MYYISDLPRTAYICIHQNLKTYPGEGVSSCTSHKYNGPAPVTHQHRTPIVTQQSPIDIQSYCGPRKSLDRWSLQEGSPFSQYQHSFKSQMTDRSLRLLWFVRLFAGKAMCIHLTCTTNPWIQDRNKNCVPSAHALRTACFLFCCKRFLV